MECQPSVEKPGRETASPLAGTLADDWIAQPSRRKSGEATAEGAIRLAAPRSATGSPVNPVLWGRLRGRAEAPAGGGVPWSIAQLAFSSAPILGAASGSVKDF